MRREHRKVLGRATPQSVRENSLVDVENIGGGCSSSSDTMTETELAGHVTAIYLDRESEFTVYGFGYDGRALKKLVQCSILWPNLESGSRESSAAAPPAQIRSKSAQGRAETAATRVKF